MKTYVLLALGMQVNVFCHAFGALGQCWQFLIEAHVRAHKIVELLLYVWQQTIMCVARIPVCETWRRVQLFCQ